MSTNIEIPDRFARQLAGRCEVAGCNAPRKEDAAECSEHHGKTKKRKRSWWKRQADIRKANHRCRCGAKSRNGKRCRRCKDRLNRGRRKKPRLDAVQARLDASSEIPPPVKLEVGRDGATRTRYVPRHGQGGPSKEETQRGHLRLIADARRLDAVFEANYPSELPSIEAMPRIQRAEGRSLLASPLVRGARLRLQVAEEVDPSLRGMCAACGRPHDSENAGPDAE